MALSTPFPPPLSHNAMLHPPVLQSRTTLVVVFTLVIAAGLHLLSKLYVSKKARLSPPQSQFFNLPPELRNIVYEYLVEPEPSRRTYIPIALDFLASTAEQLRLPPSLTPSTTKPRVIYDHLNTMSLVSRQFRAEFMDVYHRNATFYSTLDASSPAAPQHNVFTNPKDAVALTRVRVCALKILATPGISGAFDPREANLDGEWVLRDKVFTAMESMEVLKDMSLNIQAAGNQLWNPLWLWHFTSQAFKESKVKAFRRMDFTMKDWNVREPNHMVRNEEGAWEWRCGKDHLMQKDIPKRLAIREFCGALYDKCEVCEPEEAMGDI